MEFMLIMIFVKIIDPITFAVIFSMSLLFKGKKIIPIAAVTGAVVGEALLSSNRVSHSWGQQLLPAIFACSIQAFICYKLIARFTKKSKKLLKIQNIEQVHSQLDYKNELIDNKYDTWEKWYEEFVFTSGQINPQLETDEEGRSLIDLMDHEPLNRAFTDGVDPKALASTFAGKFDIITFGN